jgi:tetrahydromethanopterin S-methyltransferase subunit A
MANKKTKKDFFKELYDFVENSTMANKNEVLGFIDHELELLDKKASAKGQTKTQKENVGIKGIIVNALANCEEPITITELIANCEELNGYTNQKISALVKQLVDDGSVVRGEKVARPFSR